MLRKFLLFLIALNFVVPSFSAADQVYFYHTDPAGTPLSMTNSTGSVVWKADYKPFGEENSAAGTASNDRRFVGKEKDEETGLSSLGARYQDAKIGRFISTDPVRAVDANSSKTRETLLTSPQKLNAYTYCLNNPFRYSDSSGLTPAAVTVDDNIGPNVRGGGGIGGGSLAGEVASEAGLSYGSFRGPSGGASTVSEVSAAATRAAQSVGSGRGPVYGTRVHTAFEGEIKALGRADLTTEQSFLGGIPVKRGTPGSVRVDVVEGPLTAPTAIYDLKTGGATLTPARIRQLQQHVLGGPSAVPILEIRP